MSWFLILFLCVAAVIAIGAVLTMAGVFAVLGRVRTLTESSAQGDTMGPASRSRQAVSSGDQPAAHAPALKCRNCGATVDSLAELTGDGRVRCHYCNSWTSIA